MPFRIATPAYWVTALTTFSPKVPDYPDDVRRIKNALVGSAYGETPIPADVQRLYDWIETENWDKLINDLDEGCAIDLSRLKDLYFSDEELAADLKIPAQELTDGDRIDYVKHRIKWEIDNDEFLTAHAYSLTDQKSRNAVVGCLISGHQGHSGPAVYWQGVFANRNAFIAYLHEAHIWLFDEIERLPASYFLSLWKYSKTRGFQGGRNL